MSSSSSSTACDQCQTPLPAEAKFCPACGQLAHGTSGTRRLDSTIHEGDRLAAGHTLLSGLALYEVLLGVRRSRRGAHSGGAVIDAVPEAPEEAAERAAERTTAPEGVPIQARAEVMDPSRHPELEHEQRYQRSAALDEVPFPRPEVAPSRVSEGTMWRWQRLRELIDQQANAPPTRENAGDSEVATDASLREITGRRLLRHTAVRLSVIAALVIVGTAVVIALAR